MKFFASLVALLVVLAASCGSDDGSDSASADDADSFVGEWALDSGTLDGAAFPIVDGWRVTMRLDDHGGIDGTAACNGYGGSYEIDGSTLSLGEISITEMGCEQPVMESEAAFLQVLQRELQLERVGDELAVRGDGVDLTFSIVSPIPASALVGTNWVLDTIIDGDAASSTQGDAFLFLDADGSMTGSTGCRDLIGRYEISGDSLNFPELSAEGECTADFDRQDNSVISVLESARIEISENRLTLITAGNEGLGFRAG